jgi:hypothetical protein
MSRSEAASSEVGESDALSDGRIEAIEDRREADAAPDFVAHGRTRKPCFPS